MIKQDSDVMSEAKMRLRVTSGVRLVCPVANSSSCKCCSKFKGASWFKLQNAGAIFERACLRSLTPTSPITVQERENSSDVVALTRSAAFGFFFDPDTEE